MFAWTINWRKNLFLGMLMLLLVNSFLHKQNNYPVNGGLNKSECQVCPGKLLDVLQQFHHGMSAIRIPFFDGNA